MRKCSECSALLKDNLLCRDYLNQMIEWDFSDFSGVGKIHLLTVLCYYLQHPSLYSQEGLNEAINNLKEIIENKISYNDLIDNNKKKFSSTIRNWKFKGIDENKGKYLNNVKWSITADQIVNSGLNHYVSNVHLWLKSIYDDLKSTQNL